MKTREELEENQMKRFNWEQDQIAHMKVKETRIVMCYDQLPNLCLINVCWLCSIELHRQVWSRLCKAGPAGPEQRENSAEDGGVRFD